MIPSSLYQAIKLGELENLKAILNEGGVQLATEVRRFFGLLQDFLCFLFF
jgi:hypothetical protein